MLLAMFNFGSTTETIILFIIINVIIKIIPYLTLSKNEISNVYLFIIYCIWIYINNESILEFFNKVKKNETLLISILIKIKNYLS